MPVLSVIVPVYNVEEYLPRCIDSILAQKYDDFELILVNDGSEDLCEEIIYKYASCDKRIVTISQQNRGVSAARNRGLQAATGKYIYFIDADDWIEGEMFRNMIGHIKESGADLICCNWRRNYEDGHEEPHAVPIDVGTMKVEEFVSHVFDSPRTVGGSIWNKIFVRDKIDCFFDESVKVCEDNLFLLSYCTNIDRVFYDNKAYYHIFERHNSATRGKELKSRDILPIRRRLVKIAGEIGPDARNAAECDYLDQCCYYLNNTKGSNGQRIKKCMRRYCRCHIKEITRNNHISWKLKIRYFLI